MPKKESGAQGRKRRAQFEASLNESRKFMKKYFKSSGYAKRQSVDIRRQDKSAGTDNHGIVKHMGRKIFVCPGVQDTLVTPLVLHILVKAISGFGSGDSKQSRYDSNFSSETLIRTF